MGGIPLQIKNPIHQAGWENWLGKRFPIGFFHTAAWARVLAQAYGYRPVYFTLCRQDGPAALLPVMEINSSLTGKRGVSLPFTDECSHLAENANLHQEIIGHAIQFAVKHGWRSVAFRTDKHLPPPAMPFCRYLRHGLNLGGADYLPERKMRKSTMRNVKRALRSEVRVTISHTIQAFRIFHRLNGLTRKHHGLPPQPWYFFEAVFEHVINKGLGDIFLAHLHDRPIAGAVFFAFRQKAYYKYGASNRAYQRHRANNLIMWKAIEHYHTTGYQTIDFGRTELNHQGLRQFKRGWGTDEDYLYYYLFDTKRRQFLTESETALPGYRLLKSLPIPVLRCIGHFLYPHVG